MNGDRDSAQDKIQRMFDVKSPLLSTSKLRKHGYSVLLADNPEERHHDRVDRPERVADTGTETREQNWRGR